MHFWLFFIFSFINIWIFFNSIDILLKICLRHSHVIHIYYFTSFTFTILPCLMECVKLLCVHFNGFFVTLPHLNSSSNDFIIVIIVVAKVDGWGGWASGVQAVAGPAGSLLSFYCPDASDLVTLGCAGRGGLIFFYCISIFFIYFLLILYVLCFFVPPARC